MQLTGLDLFFWVASLVVNCLLLLTLIFRRREFPVFRYLVGFYVARTVALYFVSLHASKHTYFNVYWSLAVLDVILQFLVLLEIAFHVVRPTGTWAPDLRRSFWRLSGMSVFLAVGLTWLAEPATRLPVQTAVIRGNFFTSVLMSELFVGLLALSVTAGLPWKMYVMRVAQGWGVYSLASILVQTGQAHFGVARGSHTYLFLSHFRIAAYLGCAAYWIVTLLLPAPQPRDLPLQWHEQLFLVNEQLASALQRLRVRRSV